MHYLIYNKMIHNFTQCSIFTPQSFFFNLELIAGMNKSCKNIFLRPDIPKLVGQGINSSE